MHFPSDRGIVKTTEVGEKGSPMAVIALGLPRCATKSLKEAFESKWMEYKPCMHMAEVLPNSHRRQLVLSALREVDTAKRQKILAELFEGHVSSSDFPGAAFALDLLDMYPDAKFILNQRNNGTEWEKSYNESISFGEHLSYYLTAFLFSMSRDHYNISHLAWKFWASSFNLDDPRDKINGFGLPQFYDKYNQSILEEGQQRGIKILEWRPQDGWKPLCDFLGKEVPPADVPFPRSNDKNQMLAIRAFLMARGALSWILLGTGAYYGLRHRSDLVAKVQAFFPW